MDQHEAVLEKFAFSNALCLSGEMQSLRRNTSFVLTRCKLFTDSLFFSEVGDMGGGFGQLCRVNSVNSRGKKNQMKREFS